MKTVLIVEDNSSLGKAIYDKLTKASIPAVLAVDAKSAFEALEFQEIGLVYLDILISGDLDGFDVLRRMKQDDRFKQIPVIVLSNLGEFNTIEKAIDIGADDYIVKVTASLQKLVEVAQKRDLK